MKSLIDNETWKLGQLPKGVKPISNKWIFKTKLDAEGNYVKRKARLVAKGFTQERGVNYEETYAPVAKMTSIRLLFLIMAIFDLESRKVDFVTAFLNGEIEKGYEIWMKAPEGYNTSGLYLKLLKGLYGLKQAARLWMYKLHTWLLKLGFTQSYQDPCIYIRINVEMGETFVIGIFVDAYSFYTQREQMLIHS